MSESRKQFGINGFGRIGRTALRVWWQYHRDTMDLKMINTSGSMELEDWALLIKYDSNYGPFSEEIRVERQQSKKEVTDANPVLGLLHIGDRSIVVTAQRDPSKLPWGANGVETVIESTGVFRDAEKAGAHLQAGAKTVIISAPGKGEMDTSVIGVKDHTHAMQVLSNASCTTNCVAPVAKVMFENFGIERAMMTTIHSYTDDQNLHDNSHKDMRRARAAAQNIVPTSTGAAKAVGLVIPELQGIFEGLAMRVPTATGSISDMTFITKKETSIEEVNRVFTEAAAAEHWRGILAVTNDPIVSSDIKGRRESSIVDLDLTNVSGGTMVKVVSWYDNEFGYCNRLVEQVGRA